ncbi:MAG: Bax inhibitor-1/YccA family protein [Bacillota bacterium]|nr:Bax inhibitor-1/YccA family protein [Bacillota bacterium]
MESAAKGMSSYLSNPVVRKLQQKTESLSGSSPNVASFAGVTRKTLYFLGIFLVGILSYFLIHSYFIHVAGKEILINISETSKIFNLHIVSQELLLFLAVSIISIFFPLLAWIIRPLIPVVGTFYSLAQGYMIGFLVGNFHKEYQWIGFVAFGVTFILLLIMLVLYDTGFARGNKKILSVLSIIFLTSLILSALGFVAYIIPWTKPYVGILDTFLKAPIISLVLCCLGILVATLFLLVDFNVIENCIANQMPKKMEWMAAWGLSYTLIYIYFKVFRLCMRFISIKKG